MSLKQILAFSPAQYINDIAALPETSTLEEHVGTNRTGTMELRMMGQFQTEDAIWLQSRDQILTTARVNSKFAGSLNATMRLDPEFNLLDAPGSVYMNADYPTSPEGQFVFFPGQYNPDTGQQLIISSWVSDPNTSIRTFDVDALTHDLVTPYPTPNGDFSMRTGFPTTPGSEGYWGSSSPGTYGIIFDGLTDGIPGETLATGANVYPKGLYLANTSSSHINGQAFGDSWVWADLATRNGVGRLGGNLTGFPTAFPIETTINVQSLTYPQAEPVIGNHTFNWVCHQFVPDGDTTFAFPKGRLIFHSKENTPNSTVNVGNAQDQKLYIRFTDFNPFGVSASTGQPERVHGRIRLTSRWNLNYDPQFGLAGQESSFPFGPIRGLVFDPLRNHFVWCMGDYTHGGQLSPFLPFGLDANTTVAFLSLQINPDIITSPNAVDVPRTGTFTEYVTVVSGDLAEPVVGQSVDWTLSRLSTEGEVLDASTFPGTSTVANGPIDLTLDGVSPVLQISADGSLLALTTDYTVVASTGVITWVTDQRGATLVTATYEHRATKATPAHGFLTTSASQTDEAGLARTTIFYPDDSLLVGTLDTLEVELG